MENVDWKPKGWVSFVLALFVGPFAFLYANSVKLFWCFFALVFMLAIALFYTGAVHVSAARLISPLLCVIGVWVFVVKGNKPIAVKRWYSSFWWVLFVAFVLLIFIVRSFLYEPFRIPAGSMRPAFNVDDVVIVSKACYGSYGTFGIIIKDSQPCESLSLKRGHVYAFKRQGVNVVYLKRLIGLPNDRIEIKDNRLYLNGHSVEQQFLSSNQDSEIYQEQINDIVYEIKKSNKFSPSRDYAFTVPEGQYFLLGDNRDNSADSRHYGAIQKEQFVGHVVHVMSPLSK